MKLLQVLFFSSSILLTALFAPALSPLPFIHASEIETTETTSAETTESDTQSVDSSITSENIAESAESSAETTENIEESAESSETSENIAESAESSETSENDTGTENAAETAGEAAETDGTGTGPTVSAPAAVLMEASTGTVLYEKDSHTQMRPASITKIMTLILIFEALDKGQISLSDSVTVSEHAAGMGGSQVYLEAGETQTVQDLIKCISIASANDACVAMAEFIAGSEDAFVGMMNEKAKALGMEDTLFVNSCGLEAEGHLTSAWDVAIMARELSVNHPEIFDYCTIWMDSITHHTAKGDSEFGLTNTNKLIRFYSYATGLKTGYTSQSKYCLAATATRDNVDLIAVVMAEETPTVRTKDAVTLLDYGFAHCKVYTDPCEEVLPEVEVKKGTETSVSLSYQNPFSYVITDGSGTDSIERSVQLPDSLEAPVQKNDIVGSVVYNKDGVQVGSVPILAANNVDRLTFSYCWKENLMAFLTVTGRS